MNNNFQGVTFTSGIPIATFKNKNQSEHQELFELDYCPMSSENALQTVDNYVLDSNAPILKEWIESCIKEYVRNYLASHQKLKITQSWCLKHDGIQSRLGGHFHPNSFISGAYYIKCTEISNGITFLCDSILSNSLFEWEFDNILFPQQNWLWREYPLAVDQGTLVLFPSQLTHFVRPSNGEDSRCVLSFNTWFDGTIGNARLLTELRQ